MHLRARTFAIEHTLFNGEQQRFAHIMGKDSLFLPDLEYADDFINCPIIFATHERINCSRNTVHYIVRERMHKLIIGRMMNNIIYHIQKTQDPWR